MAHRVGLLLVDEGFMPCSGRPTSVGALPELAEHLVGLSPTNGRRQADEARETLAAYRANPDGARHRLVREALDGLVEQINYVHAQARTGLSLVESPDDCGDWEYVAAA